MKDYVKSAALAAGRHLERKESGDALDILTAKMAKFTDEIVTRTKEAEAEARAAKAIASEIEQKSAREGGMAVGPESWGEQFVKSDRLKDFSEDRSRPGRFRMEVKDITHSGGRITAVHHDAEITTLARPTPRIRDLLPVVSVGTNSVEYVAQTSRPNSAATVAEGQIKPESTMGLELRTINTQVIAHWLAASRQVLDDSAQLRDLIDGELRYGLMEHEDAQILNGDGVSPNLHGLVPQATAFSSPVAVDGSNMIDIVAAGILQAAIADLPADGIIMHPSDVMRLRMMKDNDGRYILGNPGEMIAPRLWGLPIVETKAIAEDKFLIGNFKAVGTLYDRWAPHVMVSSEHADFFVRNMVAILAEERIALAVKRPEALIYGDFGNIA